MAKGDGKTLDSPAINALRQAGLFIRDNCYYTIGSEEEDPVMISNFIMEPMFDIGDDNNGTRIYILKNETGDRRLLVKKSEMCSLNAFQQKVGTLENFIWLLRLTGLTVSNDTFMLRPTRQRESGNSGGTA